ncbi:MAG: hypothetical protein DAHOPDDO_00839 [Ignavibacteriaceae bacterium]|nr:hypothetical protein [Ignavibacteriaceae bacterium]
MCSLLKTTIFTLLVSLIIIPNSLAQTYGELFSKQQADEKFGAVIQSVTISRPTFKEFLTQTNNYIMFKVLDNKVIILDAKRNVIFPRGETINSTDIFTMFSVSVVNELLSMGNENNIYIEQRSEVISVSSGGFTMEVGTLCPPFCPND